MLERGCATYKSSAIPPLSTEHVPGLYILHLRVGRTASARIGKLGEFVFPEGHYLYVGSALNSLWPRVRRHLDGRGPRHWHIDHLRDVACVRGAWVAVTMEKWECQLVAAISDLEGVAVWPPRFGASDCRCSGHLLHSSGAPQQVSLIQKAHHIGLKLAPVLPD